MGDALRHRRGACTSRLWPTRLYRSEPWLSWVDTVELDSQTKDAAMTSLARAMMSMLLVMRVAGGGGDSDPPGAELPAGDVHPSQLPWDRVDTVAVLGSGPMWDEPPFYQVFDAVLDNEGDAVFLVNGGDGELIRYDIGSGRTSRIGKRGSGPGEFGRPVWLEPHGPDSLLAYDMSLGRFHRPEIAGNRNKWRGSDPAFTAQVGFVMLEVRGAAASHRVREPPPQGNRSIGSLRQPRRSHD